MAVIAFGVLGIFATSKDSHTLLVLYGSMMSLIFLIQLITGAVGLSVRNSSNFNKYVENVFKDQFNTEENRTEERDFYQRQFQCCGWQSPLEYNVTKIPDSCCANKPCTTQNSFGDGCRLKLTDASRFVIETACSILVTFSLFNLISIILSFILARQIRNGYQYT